MENSDILNGGDYIESPLTSNVISETLTEGLLQGGDLQGLLAIVYGAAAFVGVVVFLIFIAIFVVRLREHKATVSMRKDISAIRELLERGQSSRSGSGTSVLPGSDLD